MSKRNEMLDFVRGSLMLIVVLAHAIQVCNGMDAGSSLHRFIRHFQMEALFAVSGFAMAYSSSLAISAKIRFGFARLAMPYLVWALGMFLEQCLVGKQSFAFGKLLREALVSDFWFLRVLFGVIVLFAVCNRLSRGSLVRLVFMMLPAALFIGYVPGAYKFFLFSAFFLLGYLLNRASVGSATCDFAGQVAWFKWVAWIGVNSLALYAVHWNLLFKYFPYSDLGITWITAGSLHLYLRATIVFAVWMIVSVVLIAVINRSRILARILFGVIGK